MQTKRQDVVDTATRLFAQHGYQAVGIDRIIAESGVAKMTMYKYFSSKSDLIIEVLKQREASVADALTAFVNSYSDPLDRVKAVFVWHDRWMNDDTFAGCMFINAANEHFGREQRVVEVSAAQKLRFIAFFEQLVVPIVGKKQATSVAGKLMILLDGAIVAAHVYGNLRAARDAEEMAVKLLLSESP